MGSILAVLVATLLSSTMSRDVQSSWGWRIPFLVAVPETTRRELDAAEYARGDPISLSA